MLVGNKNIERSQASGRGDVYTGFFGKMEGQLNLFPEEHNPVKVKKKREKGVDPSQTFDERMKRFWHYMDTKEMNEQWIETCVGELRIVIDALADYYDMTSKNVETMGTEYPKAVWEHRLKRIKQIQTKLEESTGYNRDKQIEICKKRKQVRNDDIGEDALVIVSRRRARFSGGGRDDLQGQGRE